MRDRGTYAKGNRGKADRLFSLIVRSRGACEACGEREYRKLQTAHIVRRAYSATRTDEDNALCLCWSCHRRFTDDPIAWVRFLEQHIGTFEMDRLRQKAEGGVKAGALFWQDELARLQDRCARLGINPKAKAS